MSVKPQAAAAEKAFLKLQGLSSADKNIILSAIADGITERAAEILAANERDLEKMSGKSGSFYERLSLNPARVKAMAEGVRQIAALPDPVGEITREWSRESGITIKKVRAPIGVIAIIYEARPNVTADASALCVKSGNAVILRGGKDAIDSNRAIYRIIKESIEAAGFNSDIVQFIDDESRDAVKELLKYDEYIDAVIPRGGEGLKRFILENTDIPVLASAGGNCHIYVEKTADLNAALKIIENAKCQRPSTCNAVEHLLIDREIAEKFIPVLYKTLADKGVVLLGGEDVGKIEKGIAEAAEDDYDTEFLDLKLTLKIVGGCGEAIDEINKRGTRHSEAILSRDENAIKEFTTLVDAAAVYVNASTRFTDGFEYGFGAEMGISTGKLHARGPIGLEQLTTERYIVTGDGAIRK